MTLTRTVVSILAAATAAAGLLAATGAWAHHGDGDGTSGIGRAAPGAKFAAPLREAPAGLPDSLVMRQAFPDHPGKADPGAIHSALGCNKSIDPTGTIFGVEQVGDQDNHICSSADIDSFVGLNNGRNYLIQAGGDEAAFIITDVEDPTSPIIDGPWYWTNLNIYTPDVKTFDAEVVVDGETVVKNYAVLALERLPGSTSCGVVIIDVTDGTYIKTVSQTNDFDTGGWCDVHNVFVDKDAEGLGTQIYLTADATNDMRILDISGGVFGGTPEVPVEIGGYKADTANSNNYVHDITVVDHGGSKGKRAYLAYWDTGLVVLNVNDPANPVELIGPNLIGNWTLDPSGFLNHHSFPTPDGNYVFIQDEFYDTAGDEPVQMWNITDLLLEPVYVDGIKLDVDIAVNPAHNLEIREDLAPGRLYTGWYKLGLQAFDYTIEGFTRTGDDVDGVYHQAQTDATDDEYDGAWGVRLAQIGGNLYVFQSDRRYGLVVDCEGDGSETGTESCPEGSVGNQAPTAIATTDTPTPTVNESINLLGSGSIDPDYGPDPLTYSWTVVKAPKRANFSIAAPNSKDTTFQTDRHGGYTFQLEIFDGLASDIAQLIISVAKSGSDGGGKPGGGGKICADDDPRPKCNR